MPLKSKICLLLLRAFNPQLSISQRKLSQLLQLALTCDSSCGDGISEEDFSHSASPLLR